MVHLLAGIAWDPQIRGFLAVAVGVVVLMGSVYLLLVTNLGVAPRLPPRPRRLLRLVHDHGRHLVGVRHDRHARRGTHWEVKEVVYTTAPPTTPASRTPTSRRPATLDTSRPARRPRSSTSSTRTQFEDAARRARAHPRRLAAPPRVEPELRRGQGHRRRVLRREPRRGARARGRGRLRHRLLLRDAAARRACPTTRAGSTASPQAEDHVRGSSGTRPTTPSSRCSP